MSLNMLLDLLSQIFCLIDNLFNIILPYYRFKNLAI